MRRLSIVERSQRLYYYWHENSRIPKCVLFLPAQPDRNNHGQFSKWKSESDDGLLAAKAKKENSHPFEFQERHSQKKYSTISFIADWFLIAKWTQTEWFKRKESTYVYNSSGSRLVIMICSNFSLIKQYFLYAKTAEGELEFSRRE